MARFSARIEDIISDKSHGTKERSESEKGSTVGEGTNKAATRLDGPFFCKEQRRASCENQFSKVNF